MKRSGRRVALLAWYPSDNPALPPFIPNMGMYMVAAALRAANLEELDLRIWDESIRSPADVAQEISAFDPDVIGGSAFLWSLSALQETLVPLLHENPHRLLVLGGPSARPNMLALSPFARIAGLADVLVEGEGETVFSELIAAKDRSPAGLASLSGLTLRQDGGGWRTTKSPLRAVMDQLASPYGQGLIPPGGIGLLETYRGCPFTCSFCEWGVMEAPKNVLSSARIAGEFSAMENLGLGAVLLADAGLNLNSQAFAALRRAAEETGFLTDRALIAEVYPKALTEDHIRFLGTVGAPHIGVGLQSFDDAVLRHVERKFDPARLGGLMDVLRSVASVTTELIMGLPGDSPERFLKSFERARALGTGLRVYHCAVLPSALMARAPVSDMMDFDPLTLKMRRCRGWPGDSIGHIANRLTKVANEAGGASGDYFWVFPPI
jgi:radical SAM superfamily enzyme YgiQ (UPF0313 family)